MVITILIFSVAGCNSKNLTSEKQKDFNFILDYGIMGKNQIDTFKGTYTKDMVTVPSVTTELKLTEAEINDIYTKMQEIGIFNYPDNFYEETNQKITPFSTYKFKIKNHSEIKEIVWMDETLSESKKAKQLRSLIEKIKTIVENKDKYKKLPQPVGGYK